MKNNVITIMKKECSRIFNDRKLFVTTVILPGVLIFVMYTLMGTFMADLFAVDDDYVYQVHAVNLPDSMSALLSPEELRLEIIPTAEGEIEYVKERITNRTTDLLLIFPQNFDEYVAVFDPATATQPAPNIQMWHNHARTESSEANNIVRSVINAYHHALTHRFNINAPTEDAPEGNFNLATDADMFAMIMGMLVPLLFILFIFTGCQALAPESIAGEKERGTLGSVLVTPTNRRDIALGKILGIGIFALLSAVVSILGTVLAMPNLMVDMDMGNIFEFYSVADFALLLLVALSTTLVFVALLSVLSAYSKSVKEATAASMPVMIIVVLAGLAGMIFGDIPTDPAFYLIPIVNSSLSISGIFSFDINVANVLITVGINIVIALVLTVVLARMFSSEKIVFDK
jgi:sodium transport system permease protein